MSVGKKKAQKGLSSVGKLFRIMTRAALCSAELCSTYFHFSKNIDLKTELSIYHCSLHCTKLELCEVALGWFSGICFCFWALGTALLFFSIDRLKNYKINWKNKCAVGALGYKNYDRKPAVQGKSPFFAFFSVGGGNIKSKLKKEAFIFLSFFIWLDDNY